VSRLRLPLRLYVVAVIVAGAAALALAAAAPAAWTGADPILVVALGALAAVGKLRPAHVSAKLKVSLDDTGNFAAALLVGPFASMALAAAATLIALRFSTKMPLYNRLFNASATGLSTLAASTCFLVLAGPGPVLLSVPGAILAAAVVGYVVRTGLVDGAIALQLRRNPLGSWWRAHRTSLAQTAALYGLGVLAALSVTGHPWALILFVLPMAMIMFSLSKTTRMRERTKAALVELADLIDQRDRYTYGHSLRVAAYAERLARQMKLSAYQVELVTEAARLHDIGKITTPDHILQKPGPLTADDWRIMRQHCQAGHRLLQQLPEFWEGAELVLCHHERYDGTGYPRGRGGIDLPLEASIIAVCDAYDAMTTDRVYRPALPPHRVREELRHGRGTQWHALAVDGLLALMDTELASVGFPAGAIAPTAS
jgi:putative nucleotidyltransferase with HDIG domain